MRRRGFTLIELLVVIAIIAILAAILFPVFAQARQMARQATCLSNQKQIGNALMMYAQDYDEYLPIQPTPLQVAYANQPGSSMPDARWQVNGLCSMIPYVKTTKGIFKCPSCANIDTREPTAPNELSDATYHLNGVVLPRGTAANPARSYASIAAPASIVWLHEDGTRTNRSSVRPVASTANPPTFTSWNVETYNKFHSNGANLLYCDGHAKWKRQDAIAARDFGLNGNQVGVVPGNVALSVDPSLVQ